MADRSKPRYLGVIEGGRAQLERQLLRAIVFNLPGADELARSLEPSANPGLLQLFRAEEAAATEPTKPEDQIGLPNILT